MKCQHCGDEMWVMPGEGAEHGCADEYFARNKASLRMAVSALPDGHHLEVKCFNKREAAETDMIMHRLFPRVRYYTTSLRRAAP